MAKIQITPLGKPPTNTNNIQHQPFNRPSTPQKPVQPPVTRPSVVEQPATPKTNVEQNPELVAVELPSNYLPYSFKSIATLPIKGKHQAKFSAAGRRESLRLLVETISSLIEGASAFDLTTPDFRWLLYYLRRVNYVRVPLTITVHCTNEQHLLDVQDGKKHPSTLANLGTLNKSSFTETAIDEELVKVAREDEALQGFSLGFQTMHDTVAIVEMAEELEKDESLEDQLYLAEMASFLTRVDESGNIISIQDRMKVVEEMTPDETAALQKYAIVANDYGVSEFIKLPCMGCGAEIVEKFHFSASMFC
jgi:hypothetical protein